MYRNRNAKTFAQNQNTGEYQTQQMFPVQGNKAIIGVPVGDWEQVGQIPRAGGLVKIGNDSWRLRRPQKRPSCASTASTAASS